MSMEADDCWFRRQWGRKHKESSLVGEFVNQQGGRTGLVTAPVVFGRVQISLRVPGVVGTPHRYRGAGDGNLENTHSVLFHLQTFFFSQLQQNVDWSDWKCLALHACKKQSDRLRDFYLKDIGFVDEAHEGQEAAVRPAVDGDSTEVHKLVLACSVVQPFHLVLNLHLSLRAGGAGETQ